MKTATCLKAALALGAAAMLMTSCNKEENNSIVADGGTSSVVLKIDLGQTSTKAAMTPDDEWNTNSPSFTHIDIYFTDASGSIKYAYRAKSGASGDAATIWENYASGVRFIGMLGVSQVYVVANGPEIITGSFDESGTFTGTGNVNALNIDIEDYLATSDQNTMPYIGADRTATPVTGTVDEKDNKVVIDESAEGGPYVSFEISIRPAVSRIEINEVSIQKEGTLYFKEVEDEEGNITIVRCDESDNDVLYKISYDGFDGILTGVYMSDFYRDSKLFETSVNMDNWALFSTPTFSEGQAPIAAGDWVSIEDIYNDASRYSNWNGSSYGSLVDFATYGGTEGALKYFFDGPDHNNVVIPFNILLPYDVTSGNDAGTGAAPQVEITTPRLHFQLMPDGDGINVTSHQKYDENTWKDITDNVEIAMLDGLVQWPYTIGSDGVAYANVKSFATDEAGETAVSFMTGKIYKLQNVLITPDVLTTDTKTTTSSNVIVTVQVVNFVEENVYPVFD